MTPSRCDPPPAGDRRARAGASSGCSRIWYPYARWSCRVNPFLRKLGIELPIIQAPMAGVSTPEMAAAVSNAGALGSIGVGAVDAEATRQMIAVVRAKTDRPFNVN